MIEQFKLKFRRKSDLYALIGLVVFILVLLSITPPLSFPSNSIITVKEGMGLFELSEKLEEEKVIRSPILFRMFAITFGGERLMKAGQYQMHKPQNSLTLAWRILVGDSGIDMVKVRVPEGFSVPKIAELFDQRFTYFNKEEFIKNAPEGYLFPDTYFIPVTATASIVIDMMRDNFTRQILAEISAFDMSERTLGEIVVMASIIEREAMGKEDKEIVSGILWKRIEIGMPLQVDATFAYVNGESTKSLSKADLKIDSPFNTYLYKGLPPKPIANPGIESIEAAINPTTTPYLYFLTSDDGVMHYSKTFAEHVSKKNKYISN